MSAVSELVLSCSRPLRNDIGDQLVVRTWVHSVPKALIRRLGCYGTKGEKGIADVCGSGKAWVRVAFFTTTGRRLGLLWLFKARCAFKCR